MAVGRPDVEKYTFTERHEDENLTIVVVSFHPVPVLGHNYNVILSVHSRSKNYARELSCKVAKELGLNFRDAPEFLKELATDLTAGL